MAAPLNIEERYIFRPAKKSDYEDVLDINRHIYDDHDYLPGKYIDYMDHWANFGIVAQDRRNDKLIAFDMATVVDDGETMVDRAGRTRSGYQRQGVMYNLVHNLMAQLPDMLRRNLKYSAFTTSSLIPEVYGANVKQGTPLILAKTYLYTTEDYIEGILDKCMAASDGRMSGGRSIKQLDAGEIGSLFACEQVPSCFLPDARPVVAWVPFRARGRPMNAKILVEMEDMTVFATCSGDDYSAVSFGTRTALPLVGDAIRLDLDIYTTELDLVRGHMHHQLHAAARHYPGKRVGLHTALAYSGATEGVMRWSSDVSMGLQLAEWGPWEVSDQVLFETPFSLQHPRAARIT